MRKKGFRNSSACDKICYIGKVLENNLSDKTVHIDFIIQSCKVIKIFPWSNKHDRVLDIEQRYPW